MMDSGIGWIETEDSWIYKEEGWTFVPTSRPKTGVRGFVWERDEGWCQYCFEPGCGVDHILPKSSGGLNTPENLVVSCETCNQLAADFLFDSFEEKRCWIQEQRGIMGV